MLVPVLSDFFITPACSRVYRNTTFHLSVCQQFMSHKDLMSVCICDSCEHEIFDEIVLDKLLKTTA